MRSEQLENWVAKKQTGIREQTKKREPRWRMNRCDGRIGRNKEGTGENGGTKLFSCRDTISLLVDTRSTRHSARRLPAFTGFEAVSASRTTFVKDKRLLG